MPQGSSTAPSAARVLIAGGGFAALEAALALRALAKDQTQLTLISPKTVFAYRPAATSEVFAAEPVSRYEIGAIAADLGATHVHSALELVAPHRQWLRLESGITLDYDYLVIAVGARARLAIPGATAFRDQRDVSRFRGVLGDLAAGRVRRLVFAVPSHNSWSLPAYELAFTSQAYAAECGEHAEILIVTPERAPLAIFGPQAARLVGELLAERGITFVGGSIPHSVRRDGSLALQFDAPISADRVVAVPELHGPRLAGLPSNWTGFVPTDSTGRVEGLANVFAAGDVTTYPIKQGGLAAQEADVVAQAIAVELGAPAKELHPTRVLRARLLHGDGAVVLRTELDALGHPLGSTLEHRERRIAPELKVFGRYLTPYLSTYRSPPQAA